MLRTQIERELKRYMAGGATLKTCTDNIIRIHEEVVAKGNKQPEAKGRISTEQFDSTIQ